MQVRKTFGIIFITLICACDCVTVNPLKHEYHRDNNEKYSIVKVKFPESGEIIKVKFPVSTELMKSSSDIVPKIRKIKRTKNIVDNVRGEEFIPVSRDNIKTIKSPKFHGRIPPPKARTSRQKSEPFQLDFQKIKYEQQQVNMPIKSVKSQLTVPPTIQTTTTIRPTTTTPEPTPVYQENDGPFYPLMKPSPINVIPVNPPSNDAIHQYIRYLKHRQRMLYNDIENEKPAYIRRQLQPVRILKPYDGEIIYFTQREQELADEARGTVKNQLSINDFGKTDQEIVRDELRKTKTPKIYERKNVGRTRVEQKANRKHSVEKENMKSDESASVEYNDEEISKQKKQTLKNEDPAEDYLNSEESLEEEDDKYAQNRRESAENYDEVYDDDSDDVEESESRKFENFVPFKMYAQVRHMESENFEEPPKSDPRLKEEIIEEKRNIYYSEDGYQDKEYDHGASQSAGKVQKKYRSKREIREPTNDIEIHNKTMELLPVALALVKPSEIPNYSGQKLLNYLDELIKNSSIYIPDDSYESEEDDKHHNNAQNHVIKPKPFSVNKLRDVSANKQVNYKKYPYYNLPSDVLSEMSALRYSESMKNFPQVKRSIYDEKNLKLCSTIDEDIDPVPEYVTNGRSTDDSEKFKHKKRLGNLGNKLDCLKSTYFGSDPLDNPLFQEDHVTSTVPIPWKTFKNKNLFKFHKNPLITVYDDVISNIRAGILEDTKLRQRALEYDAKRSSSEHIPVVAGNISIASLNLTKNNAFEKYFQNLRGSKVPIFDINNYYSRISVSANPDIVDLEPKTDINLKRVILPESEVGNQRWVGIIPTPNNPNTDYVMEYVEAPIKRQYRNKFNPPISQPPVKISERLIEPKYLKTLTTTTSTSNFARSIPSPSTNPQQFSNQKRQLYHYKLL